MRIGKVRLNVRLEYVVDLDNPHMVEHAKDALYEDVQSLAAEENLGELFVVRASRNLTEEDIPEFLYDGLTQNDEE
jgi:hypothetical protein